MVLHGAAGAGGIAALAYGFSVRCVLDDVAAEADAAAESTNKPTAEAAAQPLGVQGSDATSANIPAATDGTVRIRFSNTGVGSQDAYMFYVGTADAPAQPALHFVVRRGEILTLKQQQEQRGRYDPTLAGRKYQPTRQRRRKHASP